MSSENSNRGGRVLLFGAHPDDAEFHAGAFLAACCQAGHAVRLISVTDGSAGHQEKSGAELADIRRREAAAAGSVIGAEYLTWEFPDGSLLPTLDVRRRIIREIREWHPDLVLTHRTIDYHPDHRAVGKAVEDAIFSVTVPAICPEVAALRRDPVLLYMQDRFTRPYPIQADLVLDATPYVEVIVAMLVCHTSQLFEWLPYLDGNLEAVPTDADGRREWVRAFLLPRLRQIADRFRPQLVVAYGQDGGQAIDCAEVFEVGELGRPMDDRVKARFPFLVPSGSPHTEPGAWR